MKYYILCSDDLVHDENSIYFHNKQIRVNLQQKGVTTQDIHFWSDGPSSQFKKKFNATNLKFHFHVYGSEFVCGTAHDKGENHISGEDVENVFLLQKKAVVTNLNDLATVDQEILPNLTSFHLPKRSEKFGRFSRSTLFMC